MQRFLDILALAVHVAWYAIVGVAAIVILFEAILYHAFG